MGMGMGMGMEMTNIFLLRKSISSAFSLLKARVVRAVERNHRFYSSFGEKETIVEWSFTYFIFQDANEAVRFSLLFVFFFFVVCGELLYFFVSNNLI